MNHLPASPELMTRFDTAVLVVDMQEKLLAVVSSSKRVSWNVRRLLDGAKILGLPTAATEQYPRGLGPTPPDLAQRVGPIQSKMTFSCGECAGIFEEFKDREVSKILLCGIESHVCVSQTAFDLLSNGWDVYVAVDAVGSRYELDKRTALNRMDSAGVTLTTAEAALFEWCRTAEDPLFKQISVLARENPPADD